MRVSVLLAVPLAWFLLAGPASAQAVPKVGDAVWAEWQANDWYRAKVTKKTTKGFQVLYEDGVSGEVDASKIAIDVVPDKGQVKDGTRVLAKWTDGKFYPGKAGAAKADGSYAVTFDDGDKATVKLKDIRLLAAVAGTAPTPKTDGRGLVVSPTCGAKDPRKAKKPGLGLVGNDDFFWKDRRIEDGRQVLRVQVLNGDRALQQKVEKTAHIWTEYAVGLKFVFGNDPNAEIRINFWDKNHSYSALGNGALHADYKGKPTMELGLSNASTDENISRTVLHEFGHALGFEHEHQHPKENIPWNEPEVLKTYREDYGWTDEETRANIFGKVSSTNFSAFDRESIMLYPIPEKHVTDKSYVVGWNNYLSRTDKDYAAKWYPPKKGGATVDVGVPPQIVQGKPKETTGNVTYEITVTIANKTRYDVSFYTIGARDKTGRRLKPKAAQSYTIEVDAAKGATIEVLQQKGAPMVYTVKRDASFELTELLGGQITLVDAGPVAAPAGIALRPGDPVWALWEQDGKWYHGKAGEKVRAIFQVLFDDGDTAVLPPSKIALDVIPDKGQIKEGARVLAKWSDGKFYSGKVVSVKADGTYGIEFDDGDKGSAKLKDLRLMVAQ